MKPVKYLCSLALAAASFVNASVFERGLSVINTTAVPSDVLLLDKDTFHSVVPNEKFIVVTFYTAWSSGSSILVEPYENAATKLKPLNVKLAKVDCMDSVDLCKEQAIESYPTMRFYRKDGEYTDLFNFEYKLVDYVKRAIVPPVSKLNAAEVDIFKNYYRNVIIAFLEQSDQTTPTIINQLAESLKYEAVLGVTTDPAALEKYNIKLPGVLLFNDFRKKFATYSGDFTISSLVKFFDLESKPWMPEIHSIRSGRGTRKNITTPIGYLFITHDDKSVELRQAMEDVAREYDGKFAFFYSVEKGDALYSKAKQLNLKDQWPAFAIGKPIVEEKHLPSGGVVYSTSGSGVGYPLDQSTPLTIQRIRQHLDAYLAGQLKPPMRSAPIPVSNDGPVVEVVAAEFNKLVIDPTKDVLLRFYSNLCCFNEEEPPSVWEELGKRVRANPVNAHLRIAQIDADANSIPESAGSAEGIKLFKPGSNMPISYKGKYSLHDIVEFLKTNSSHPVEIDLTGVPTVEKEDYTPRPSRNYSQPLTALSGQDVDTFKDSYIVVVIAFLGENDQEHLAVMEQVAEYNFNYVFGVTTNAEAAAKYGVQVPGVVMFRKFDEPRVIYDGDITEDGVKQFVKNNAVPLLRNADDHGLPFEFNYYNRDLPKAYLFLEKDDPQLRNATADVARIFRGKLDFLWTKKSRGAYTEDFDDLTEILQTLPAFGIYQPAKTVEHEFEYKHSTSRMSTDSTPKYKYLLNQKDLNAEHIRDFVTSYLEGKLKPYIKSQPVPATNDAPVTVIVRDEWDKFVREPGKDVLLMLYQDTGCKPDSLAETWEELAKRVRSNPANSGLRVAKFNVEKNELPWDAGLYTWESTIRLFIDGRKQPLDYRGPRTLDGIITFINQYGSHPVQ
ncbi:uncharacterized protein VTP21DRAFT_6530 [Calcarisporiella thermophila]|uniref:uncharacterized protein n=1 Tax=Calcarisporiella thermophila TaxID=911321 RepID=UPI0037420E54